MNIQALVDGMSAQWQRERAETQMTLGKVEKSSPDLTAREFNRSE